MMIHTIDKNPEGELQIDMRIKISKNMSTG